MIYNWFKSRRHRLSVVVIFHNMRREAARTLYSLSTKYQHGITDDDYEVIAVDSNSSEPLDAGMVSSFGPQFHYIKVQWEYPSPCKAMNTGVYGAKNDIVLCLVDGARILSPGILSKTLKVFYEIGDPFVYTLGMHLGPKVQKESMLDGYSQKIENQMMKEACWQTNGYSLFSISSVAPSSKSGFFSKLSESNCIALYKKTYKRVGGFDERFIAPGGGLVNLDIFNKLMEQSNVTPVMLLGEATFHQFHGGVATNAPCEKRPWQIFVEEYRSIRGKDYETKCRNPFYYGAVTANVSHLIHVDES